MFTSTPIPRRGGGGGAHGWQGRTGRAHPNPERNALHQLASSLCVAARLNRVIIPTTRLPFLILPQGLSLSILALSLRSLRSLHHPVHPVILSTAYSGLPSCPARLALLGHL